MPRCSAAHGNRRYQQQSTRRQGPTERGSATLTSAHDLDCSSSLQASRLCWCLVLLYMATSKIALCRAYVARMARQAPSCVQDAEGKQGKHSLLSLITAPPPATAPPPWLLLLSANDSKSVVHATTMPRMHLTGMRGRGSGLMECGK